MTHGKDDPSEPGHGPQDHHSERTRSAIGLDRAAQTARKLSRKLADIPCRGRRPRLALHGKKSEFFRDGTAAMPDRENGQAVTARGQRVPSRVPIDTQTAAKAAPLAYSVHNSLLRQTRRWGKGGFEPPVSLGPEHIWLQTVYRSGRQISILKKRLRRKWDQRFESSLLQRRVCEPSVPQRQSPTAAGRAVTQLG